MYPFWHLREMNKLRSDLIEMVPDLKIRFLETMTFMAMKTTCPRNHTTTACRLSWLWGIEESSLLSQILPVNSLQGFCAHWIASVCQTSALRSWKMRVLGLSGESCVLMDGDKNWSLQSIHPRAIVSITPLLFQLMPFVSTEIGSETVAQLVTARQQKSQQSATMTKDHDLQMFLLTRFDWRQEMRTSRLSVTKHPVSDRQDTDSTGW